VRLLLKVLADLLQLTSSGRGVKDQVAEFAWVRLDVYSVFLKLWIAFQNQILMLRTTSRRYCVHIDGRGAPTSDPVGAAHVAVQLLWILYRPVGLFWLIKRRTFL